MQIVREDVCDGHQEKLEGAEVRSQRALCAVLRRLDSTLFLVSLRVREYLYLGPQMDFGTLSMLCNHMTSFLAVWVCVLF